MIVMIKRIKVCVCVCVFQKLLIFGLTQLHVILAFFVGPMWEGKMRGKRCGKVGSWESGTTSNGIDITSNPIYGPEQHP